MSMTHFHKLLNQGLFTVTAEIGPAKNADAEVIKKKASLVKAAADAFNVTDNQTAVVRLSSIAASALLKEEGLEPILQLSCRDRNRIALQSEVLGASALGVHNMLFITGDHQSLGNHPQSAGVFEIDAVQLIQIVKNMRDDNIFQNGEIIRNKPPEVFIGGVCNPFSDPMDFRILRLQKKIIAGVDFIQTQSVFDVEKFSIWMDQVCDLGLNDQVFLLAGITPLKSVKMMKRMKYDVPGVLIPEKFERRMLQASDPKEEGFSIACELIDEIKKIKGVHGIHVTALFWEEIIPEIIKQTNLFPRPLLD